MASRLILSALTLCTAFGSEGANCSTGGDSQTTLGAVWLQVSGGLEKTSESQGRSEPQFLPIDGGENRACRGSNRRDNSAEHYVRHTVTSLGDCEQRCLSNSLCKGIEHRGTRCEVWVRDEGIQATVPVNGYTCLHYVTSGTTFEQVDGGDGRACRGANKSDNARKHYHVSVEVSLDACKLRCLQTAECQGIEYAQRYGRCEVWVRRQGIETSVALPGWRCLRLTRAPEFSSSTPHPGLSKFEVVDGGANRACRGAAPQDNSPSYYILKRAVSVNECKHICVMTEGCKGIEYNSRLLRCETWIKSEGIQSSVAADGFTCLRRASGSVGTTASIGNLSPLTSLTTTVTSSMPPSGCCSSFASWPDVDNGVTCDSCTALVLTAPHSGRCDRYCQSFGHVCVSAAEEENENCRVKFTKGCDEEIRDTSDMLCSCRSPGAVNGTACSEPTSPMPSTTTTTTTRTTTTTTTASIPKTTAATAHITTTNIKPECCNAFSSWPDIDNGVTCDSCTALVLTAPHSGRCDRYCQSFGHICVSAAEEENENCRVKFTKGCDEEILDTTDMLCSCRIPDAVNATTCSVSTTAMPATKTTTTTAATAVTSNPTTTAATAQISTTKTNYECCDSFSLWPGIDKGVTCDACTALVLTDSNQGRCDKYCESFGHVCVSAAEEVNEDCRVQYTKRCDEPITGTSDMLCTCQKPDAEASCSLLPSTTTTLSTQSPSPSPRRIEVKGRQLHVGGKPVHLKGVAWNPVPKGGRHPNDLDFSGFAEQDARLMQQMGINAVRTYEPITDRDVLDVLWRNGIWVLNSVYNWGGASADSVVGPVNAVKDHPAILMWTIGNEWNYNGLYTGMSFSDCIARINDAARFVRQHDTAHPIASIYGEFSQLDQAIQSLTSIDIWAINAYRGKNFGDLFDVYARTSQKPMFLGEYGADAFNSRIQQEDQQAQADATRELTEQIVAKSSLRSGGVCLGGFIFEFSDEWHKDGNGSPSVQDTGGVAPGGGPYPDSTFNEEWWGLVKIDRSPRLAFQAYADITSPHNSQLEVE